MIYISLIENIGVHILIYYNIDSKTINIINIVILAIIRVENL